MGGGNECAGNPAERQVRMSVKQLWTMAVLVTAGVALLGAGVARAGGEARRGARGTNAGTGTCQGTGTADRLRDRTQSRICTDCPTLDTELQRARDQRRDGSCLTP